MDFIQKFNLGYRTLLKIGLILFPLTNVMLYWDKDAMEAQFHHQEKEISKQETKKRMLENSLILLVEVVWKCLEEQQLAETQFQTLGTTGPRKKNSNKIPNRQIRLKFKSSLKCTMLINKFIRVNLKIAHMLN